MGIMDNEGHDPQGFGNTVTARAMQRIREEWEAPMRAEIERLRGALHKIASGYPCQDALAMMRVASDALGITDEQSAKPGEGQ